ncbi:hypothetical protein UlMin_045181 [Ulmus minor]
MEQSLSSITYKGSIAAAIAEAKNQKKLFVVYISGEDSESSRLENTTWTDVKVVESVTKYCILLNLLEGSNDAAQFSAIYTQKSIPCITAIGYNGVQLWQNEGFVSAEVLASSLEKVWLSLHIQETTAAVLSAALASKTSEPSTSGVPSTSCPDQGSSSSTVVLSSLSDKPDKSPDAATGVNSDESKENKHHASIIEEKSSESGGVAPSKSVDANEAECGIEKFNLSNEAAKEIEHPATVVPDNTVSGKFSSRALEGEALDNTEGNEVVADKRGEALDDKKTEGFDNSARVKNLSEVHLNIRLPNGISLQEKFPLTSTLRMVKDYVDEHQSSDIGPYDLAVPYPRKVYTVQDLSRSLSDLGLFDRQALIVVPHQRAKDQSNATNIVESSNETNGGYLSNLKRLISFINPFSYLGGGSSSTNSGQEARQGPNAALQNNSRQNERPNPYTPSQSDSSTSRNDGGNRTRTKTRFGSNIHTLKHDEDDAKFNDRNSFWNGNSTQYGGNDDRK